MSPLFIMLLVLIVVAFVMYVMNIKHSDKFLMGVIAFVIVLLLLGRLS